MTQKQFYHTRRWQEFREYAIGQELARKGEITCAICGKAINAKKDLICHHKQRLDDETCNDPAIALNLDNVEFVHRQCHEREHGRLYRFPATRGVYLVYGPPLAGKSTLVKQQANGDDLIIDFNSLQDALGTERSRAILPVVMQTREALFGVVERRQGLWRRAYIIGGYPDKNERDRLKDRLGATEIFIDVSEDECLRRAKNDAERGYVEKWYNTYRRTEGIDDGDI